MEVFSRFVLAIAVCLPSMAEAQAKTATQIAEYQIILWTSVLLVLILLGIIYAMLGMDSKKDPALYAQIVDPRAAQKKNS